MKALTRGALFALSATTLLVAAPAAQAQTTFAGSSSGSFTHNGTSGLANAGGLTFGAPGTPWSFDLFLGQTLSGITFGTLYLDRSITYNYGSSGDTFELDLVFSSPGGGNQLFAAALSGNITDNGNGQANINFNGPFTAALAGGYIVQVSLNDMLGQVFGTGTGNNVSPAAVTGSLTFVRGPDDDTGTTETVPEPITMILLGTGLAGVGTAARRRRKAAELV